jgi:hypothetical protein
MTSDAVLRRMLTTPPHPTKAVKKCAKKDLGVPDR